MKRDFPNILISFVFGVMILITGSVVLMAIEPQDTNPRVVYFSGGIHRNWLRVERFNTKVPNAEFDPCYTQLQSDFLPVVTKVSGKYQVAFVSDLGKDDLP